MADKMPPAPPADDDTADQTDAGADMGGGDDQGDQSKQVLCTIIKNSDGSYTVIDGDEDDESEGAEGDMGGEPGADAAPMGGAEKPEGKTFSDVGQVLKAVMDCIKMDQEASGGSAQDHFQAGFDDQSAPMAKKGAPGKY